MELTGSNYYLSTTDTGITISGNTTSDTTISTNTLYDNQCLVYNYNTDIAEWGIYNNPYKEYELKEVVDNALIKINKRERIKFL